ADIAEGLPQICAPTSETFVAQMLNLDLLGAIAFDKGCYTGQEVVARAHYRGRVKRRLQRWRTLEADAPTLEPGSTVHAEDGRKLTVVNAVRLDSGLQELLGVGAFGALPEAAEIAGISAGTRVNGPLPLPYSLPE
ncbi:MAG TPA: hypothetical protein VFS58_13395, partial [Steroidobacteraceae bacterium]|nr:hypothetical protein [Steroidobacteraceae bacterium]